MILSNKKIFYIRMIRDNGILAGMNRKRMISDLEDYGIIISESCDLTSKEIKEIYKILIKHVSEKYNDVLVSK